MVNYWIFVSVPFTDYNVGTIHEMLGKIKTSQKWSIGKGTPNRTKLAVGDKVLFYQGGENGRKIVASAELASGLQQTENLDTFVIIKNFRVWDNPVDIRPLIGKLSFIKNTKYWGVYFQGGVVKLTKEDYQKIFRKSAP